MHRLQSPICLFVALLVLAALPASAGLYTVKLTNGNTFETLYKPRLASEDGDKVLLVTEMGNWISLPVSAIDEVVSRVEARGYGKVINTTTILIGTAPNDAAVPGEGEEDLDPTERLLRYLESQRRPEPTPFTVQQFAEPNSLGGIPLSFTTQTTPPMAPTAAEPPVAGEPPR